MGELYREFHPEGFTKLLTNSVFIRTLGYLTAHQEAQALLTERKPDRQNLSAGFYVQNPVSAPSPEISPVFYPHEAASERWHEHIPKHELQDVGLYIYSAHESTPSYEDLETFQELNAAGEGMRPVQGIAAPHPLGGAAVFFLRQSETRPFQPEELSQLKTSQGNKAAKQILTAAGINSFILVTERLWASVANNEDKKLFS